MGKILSADFTIPDIFVVATAVCKVTDSSPQSAEGEITATRTPSLVLKSQSHCAQRGHWSGSV